MGIDRGNKWGEVFQHDGIGHGGIFHGLNIENDETREHATIQQDRP